MVRRAWLYLPFVGSAAFFGCSLLVPDDLAVASPESDSSVEPEPDAPSDGSEPEDASAPQGGDAGSTECNRARPVVEVLATGQEGAVAVRADVSSVYWAISGSEGTIRSVGLSADASAVDMAEARFASALTLTQNYVAFMMRPAGGALSIYSVPKGGGTTSTIYDRVGGAHPLLVAERGDWVMFGNDKRVSNIGVSMGASGSTTVVSTGASAIALDFADPLVAYVVETDGGVGLFACELSNCSGGVGLLSLEAAGIRDVAAESSAIYAVDEGAVLRFSLPDGSRTPLATAQPDPVGIALHGDLVVYATADGLRSVPKAGGCVDVLAVGTITSVSAHRDYVYFAREDTIARLKW